MVAPANDNFANAITVLIFTNGGTWTSSAIDQTDATAETGEPTSAIPYADRKSIWFKYVPSISGNVTIDTQLSTAPADTQIALWSGTTITGLTYITGDQDSGTSGGAQFSSKITSQAVTAGVTYYLQVGVWGSSNSASTVVRFVGPSTTIGRGTTTESAGKMFPTGTFVYDTYTRGDSTTVVGSPDFGGPYTQSVGTWGISGNRLYTSASTANSLLTFAAAADVQIQATLSTTNASVQQGVVARYVDSSNFWLLAAYFGNIILFRNVAGSVNQVGSAGPATADGIVLKLACYGDMIYGYVNDVLRWAVQDGHYKTATVAGLRIASSTAVTFDNLSASALNVNPMAINGSSNIHVYKGRDLASSDTGSAT